jgi:hypothetical protein
MTKYRKKPIVIEAFQMRVERRRDKSEWPEWLNRAWDKTGEGSLYCVEGGDALFIDTLEGALAVMWGDWIIQGIKGELYPCKPDIFEATYELVG